jgi:hypothetical protein
MTRRAPIRLRCLAPLALLLAFSAHAQHTRLVDDGQALSQSTDPVAPQALDEAGSIDVPHAEAADMTATAPAYAAVSPGTIDHHIGDATRRLLRLQASGQAAAPPLPMLGEASSAAYQRYMKSFSHAVPEFFDTTVSSSGSSSTR